MKVLANTANLNSRGYATQKIALALKSLIGCCTIAATAMQSQAQSSTLNGVWGKPAAPGAAISIRAVPGQSRQVIGRYQRMLQISRQLKDRSGEAAVLNRLGSSHLSAAQYDAAIEDFQQALSIQRELKQQREQGVTLNNLGNAYFYLKQYETAAAYYEQALAIRREVQDRAGEGTTLSNLALVSHALGRFQAAKEQAEQALAITREVKDREGEGKALNEAGFILLSQQCYPEAVQQLQQSLVISREVGSRALEGKALHNLMLASKAQGKASLAIFYGKQAVNVAQEMRVDDQNLDKDLQQGLVSSEQDSYRELANLLMDQGRLSEAEQVLNMLKEDEYFQFAPGDNQND